MTQELFRLLNSLLRFLMLPATFDNDPKLRISKLTLGIFAVAILAAGFSLTGLLSFAVRNPLFQAEGIYLPSVTSCSVGLLTVFYDFLISPRYVWNTASMLITIAAGLSTIVYGLLLIWTQRRIHVIMKMGGDSTQSEPLRQNSSSALRDDQWGDPGYYHHYIQNMFPASLSRPVEPQAFTDEEMQRQQMLMLLRPTNQTPTPNTSQSTFRIDWQGQDQEDEGPQRGFYAPLSNTVSEMSSPYPTGSSANQNSQQLDGVGRALDPPSRTRTASGSNRLAPVR